MKKLIIIGMLALSLIIPIKVYATTPYDEIETVDWTEYNDLSEDVWTISVGTDPEDVYFFHFELDMKAEAYDLYYIDLDETIISNMEGFSSSSYFKVTDGSTGTTHNTSIFMGDDFSGSMMYYLDYLADSTYWYSTYDLNHDLPGWWLKFDEADPDTDPQVVFNITILNDNYTLENPPTGAQILEMKSILSFKGTEQLHFVKYYNSGFLWNTDIYIDAPVEPPYLPTKESSYSYSYVFTGWRTITGDMYDFDGVVREEYLNTEGEFILYASYLLIRDNEVLDPEVSSNIPTGLSNFMDIFGGDNYFGYSLLLLIITVILIVISLIFKFRSFISIIISFIVFVFFIYIGALNVFFIILLALIYILLFLGEFLINKRAEG